MGDPVAKGIDDFWGAAHRFADALTGTPEAKRETRATTAKGNVASIARLRYRVEEVLDAESGEAFYEVVSADGSERIECNTRATADKVHRALEAMP